jgi:hypothetical protein
MPSNSVGFGFAVTLQSMISQLPLASPFHQVGRGQSTHTGKQRRLHSQQLHLAILILAITFLSHETALSQNTPNAPAVNVSPKSFVFAAEQGRENPDRRTLTVSTTGRQDLPWTVSKTASWLTLDPITGNGAASVTASVTTGSLAVETYQDVITLAIAGTEAEKIPVTFVVTPPKSAGPPAPPQKTNKEDEGFVIRNFRSTSKDPADGGCLKDLSEEPVATGDFGDYISFGPTVAAKAFNYDLASKRVAFNAGVGAGFSMRIYNTVGFKGKEGKNGKTAELPASYGISQIRKRCRAETYDLAWLKPDNQRVAPLISISPMVFASKSDRDNEIQVQPALTVGFLGELINVGAGFNLSGQDKGHVFILLSLGYGFKF